jgi:hypothetical protein
VVVLGMAQYTRTARTTDAQARRDGMKINASERVLVFFFFLAIASSFRGQSTVL